jgi:Cu+-exporting ATPase
LFKQAKFIETFAKADTIVLDKTGTITTGQLTVQTISNENISQEELQILYSLSDSSNHPVSIAIKNYLKNNYENIEQVELHNIKQIPGIGIEAMYQGKNIFGGKSEEDTAYTSYLFKIEGKDIVRFELEDTIKENTKETIEYLLSQNINVVMCSGDNESVVTKVATEVGIKSYKSNMTPQSKASFIKTLHDKNKLVIMVGDGINDSIALSQADIAIAMGNGADIALAVSDVVILNDKMEALKEAVYISRRTFYFIKQNLALSLLYNVVTIPIAMAGYVIPLIAALSMSLSSLLVVGNSMRIKKGKIDG